jgi:hypothetical protein
VIPLLARSFATIVACLALAASLFVIRPAFAQEPAKAAAEDAAIAEKLRKVMLANCEANQKEDLEAALATIHPESPTYASTRQVSEKLFSALDLKYELKSFGYLGKDDIYAVGRARVRAAGVAENQQFRDNVSDLMIAFRKHGDDWKVWSQSILAIEFE